MSYIEGLRLPTDIERGAVGGPRFNTTVLTLESGYEKRNINWQDSIGQWDVGFGLLRKFQQAPSLVEPDIDLLISMFRVCKGRAHSFRFKDWSDYEVGYQYDQPTDPQILAVGSGDDDPPISQIQLFKRYTVEGVPNKFEDRRVTKIVWLSGQFYRNGERIGVDTPYGYTVYHDTGILDLDFELEPGDEITGRFQFDCHVRFDTDDLRISMALFNAGEWRDIPLLELLGTGVDP